MMFFESSKKNHLIRTILVGFIFVFFFSSHIQQSQAETVSELQARINERNQKIQELEEQIDVYENDLEEVQTEKSSLVNTIKQLDISEKKLKTNIQVTETRIDRTNTSIEELGIQITDKERRIKQNNLALSEAIRRINEQDSQSLVETILANNSLSEVWDTLDSLEQFQLSIQGDLKELISLKQELSSNKLEAEERGRELINYKAQLGDQKEVVEYNKTEKNKLLSVTKNKEENYKNYLAEAEAAKEKFERELRDFEAQLQIELDPKSLPSVGVGVLASPLDSVFITQKFGNTEFAQSGAYNGQGHNGVDFRASTGTRVKAALGGVVVGIGNTDAFSGCYSYGKWILVRHNNGLSTLYAHLSVISRNEGDPVNTGDLVGYSGNTGYSTGPHLHFTVYASQGVKIVRLGDIKAITNCANARIPVAPFEAYLNPMSYL